MLLPGDDDGAVAVAQPVILFWTTGARVKRFLLVELLVVVLT